jgi:hypothetical protein
MGDKMDRAEEEEINPKNMYFSEIQDVHGILTTLHWLSYEITD